MIERMRWQRRLAAASLVLGLLAPAASRSEDYHGRRAWMLQNDKIQVTVVPGGGHIAGLMLRSGPGANLNPLWLPTWPSVEPGAWASAGNRYGDKPGAQLVSDILGHNICLDFFGSPSDAETKAGVPVHGEAPSINWAASSRSANALVYGTTLPLARMKVSRSIRLTPGSSALWITETVENLSVFDRPFGWQQHVTLGPPFLEEGVSHFDMNATWGMVDPQEFSKGERLKQGAEFEWPNGPGAKGDTIDLRVYPTAAKNSDFTTQQMDPKRQWAYFAAINPKKHLLVGYLWPRKVWPWAGNWEENHFRTGHPWNGNSVTRGIEFGASPFAHSRREAVTMGRLHDTPTYRWIAAREKQTVSYSAFLAPVPAGVTGVKDVNLTAKGIEITWDGVDKTVTLPIKR